MEERRLHPRFHFEQEVELRGNGDTCFAGTTSDLSAVGLGMLVSRAAVNGLAQADHILSTGDPLDIVLPASLGVELGAPLRVHCRVQQVRRLSLERYVLSAWFDDPSSSVQGILSQMVERAGWDGKGR
jgi:hypothetical protein